MIEYFTNNLWLLWTLIAAICLIIELCSGDFFLMCFCIGSIVGVLLSFTSLGFLTQLTIVVVISVLCLFFVRPVWLKHLSKDNKVSNADAIIGRIGTVSQDIIENDFGRVALDGDDWKAQSVDGQFIAKGTKVEIISRESIIINVKKI